MDLQSHAAALLTETDQASGHRPSHPTHRRGRGCAAWPAISTRCDRSVCIGKVGSRENLPPLPHIRYGFQRGLHCGERVGVRGPHRSISTPHPGPLPTAMSSPKVTPPVGRGGKNTPLPTILMHTRDRSQSLTGLYFSQGSTNISFHAGVPARCRPVRTPFLR